MPIDIDKIQDYTGIKAETTEQFIEIFDKKFMTEDQIFKDKETKERIFGRAFGSATIGVKQHFEAQGIEITGDDLKQPIEAVVKLGTQRMIEKFAIEREALEKTAGLSADEKIKEVQESFSKSQAKVKDLERLVKEKGTEFETLQSSQKAAFKQFKVGSIQKDAISAIQFNPDKDEYSKKGFIASLSEKYLIDTDENDEPFIIDRKTGSRIKAEGSHSTFMTPADVFKSEAVKEGMAAINKKAGTPAPQKYIQKDHQNPNEPPIFAPTGRPMANTRFKSDRS